MIDSFEKLLLLKANVERLEETGLVKLTEDTEKWYCGMNKLMENKNLTTIERIMFIILVDVENRLETRFNIGTPVLNVKPQTKIGKYRADFIVNLFCVNGCNQYVIECDGHDFHEKTKEQAQYDKQRERFFVQNDYRVLRYSGSEIYKCFWKIGEELYSIFEKEYLEVNDD